MASEGTSHICILDRLERLHQREQGQSVTLESMSESDVKESVRMNLMNLLNTRCHFISDHNDETLEESLVNYGIPDFLGITNSTEKGQQEFRRIVEKTISIYEPRLTNVQVELLRHDKLKDRSVFLKVNADLAMESGSERVEFRSAVELQSNSIKVERT